MNWGVFSLFLEITSSADSASSEELTELRTILSGHAIDNADVGQFTG